VGQQDRSLTRLPLAIMCPTEMTPACGAIFGPQAQLALGGLRAGPSPAVHAEMKFTRESRICRAQSDAINTEPLVGLSGKPKET